MARAGSALWRVLLSVRDADRAEAAARALDPVVESVSAFGADDDWRIEGLTRKEPDRAAIAANLALQWLGEDDAPSFLIERLPARDWLDENQKSFAPVAAGRYFVHPTSWRGRACRRAASRSGSTPRPRSAPASTVRRAAALWRSTGSRGGGVFAACSTWACGTGILAMAAAKTWRRGGVAPCDIDPEAVRVASRNARANGLRALARARARTLLPRARCSRGGAPYDLVLANILARPLMTMARDLARALAPRRRRRPRRASCRGRKAPCSRRIARAASSCAARIVVDGWSHSHRAIAEQPHPRDP